MCEGDVADRAGVCVCPSHVYTTECEARSRHESGWTAQPAQSNTKRVWVYIQLTGGEGLLSAPRPPCMSRYVFPSTAGSHSYSPYQHTVPPLYATSAPSAHSHSQSPYHSARRNSLSGHPAPYAYSASQGTHYSTPSHHAHNTATHLVVPGTSSSHRSRSRSRSSHGHGHPTSTHTHSRSHSQSRHAQPHVYTPSTAPVYLDASHHSTHRYPSTHSHHSHHSHAHSHSSHNYPSRQRTTSLGDRFRRFLGLDTPHHPQQQQHYANGNAGRRRHNSFSGYRDDSKLHRTNTTRSGPWFFGPTDNRRYIDEHGRDVDYLGRVIHRY
ncbi:hypothetical protein BKA82DRAFT_699959 [Pisolithus tinctorius]|nr:hypothetical protein BKA82DRAFT_699959 [Pisolithus tinctorius]